jgi:hypothetical protein
MKARLPGAQLGWASGAAAPRQHTTRGARISGKINISNEKI